MTHVVWHTTVLLDGFIAGPDHAMECERRPVELERTELDDSGRQTSLRVRVNR